MDESKTGAVAEAPVHVASMSSAVTWRSAMAFDATADAFGLPLDAAHEAGGEDHGPRPKTLVLTALCGCTAMDVVAILRKMRVSFEGFAVSAKAVLSDKHPKVFTQIALRYDFTGPALPLDKLERAVRLSLDSYCGVAAMLRMTAAIDHAIYVNGVQPLADHDATIRSAPAG